MLKNKKKFAGISQSKQNINNIGEHRPKRRRPRMECAEHNFSIKSNAKTVEKTTRETLKILESIKFADVVVIRPSIPCDVVFLSRSAFVLCNAMYRWLIIHFSLADHSPDL